MKLSHILCWLKEIMCEAYNPYGHDWVNRIDKPMYCQRCGKVRQ